MGYVNTYDPKQLIIVFGGVPITGYADGTFVTVTPNAERFTKVVGADGEVTRTKSNDFTHEVTITLKQSSLSNDYLSTIMNADRLSNLGKLPLQIKDINGTTLWNWSQAWIRQPPDSEFAKELGERAWIFDTGSADLEQIGGSLT